jgi:two-component system, chemotaxis family, chemotaxis protein CheY
MGSKVLVVDDSGLIRTQVKRALTAGAFDVAEAADGELALEYLRAHGPVQLVVCDVNMPRMGGLEFLEALRAEAALAHTKVIMLTTEAQVELVERARQLGARAWMVKPFKADLLLSAVTKLVES